MALKRVQETLLSLDLETFDFTAAQANPPARYPAPVSPRNYRVEKPIWQCEYCPRSFKMGRTGTMTKPIQNHIETCKHRPPIGTSASSIVTAPDAAPVDIIYSAAATLENLPPLKGSVIPPAMEAVEMPFLDAIDSVNVAAASAADAASFSTAPATAIDVDDLV